MQDRFRFRIWDKPTSKMHYDTALGFTQNNAVGFWARANTPNYYTDYTGERLKDIKIMQCTGLRDKNGKLIFEGDIAINEGTVCVINWDNDKCAFFVETASEYFAFEEDITIEDFKIIGNIYENPELLEDK